MRFSCNNFAKNRIYSIEIVLKKLQEDGKNHPISYIMISFFFELQCN